MTYDLSQTYGAFGPYSGIGNPFNAAQAFGLNPQSAWNPLTAYQGNPQSILPGQTGYPGSAGYPVGANYGVVNPQFQFAPQSMLWQNPLFVAHHIAAQQAAAQQLAQHLAAQQIVAQQLAAQQLANQQTTPYSQTGQIGFNGQPIQAFGQIGVPLAPQSWVGQAGQLGGQANPVLLAHLTARALQGQGFAPGVGFPV